MNNVSRHKYNNEIAQKLIQSANKRLPKFIEISKTKNYKTLCKVSNVLIEQIALIIRISEQNNIQLLLKNALISISGYLQLTAAPGKEFPINIDGKGPVILKADDGDIFSSGEWLSAWNLATILRDNSCLEQVYKTDISKVKSLNEKDHIKIAFLNFQFVHSLSAGNSSDESIFNEMKAITEKNLKGYYMPDPEEFPYPNYYFNFNRALILKSIIESKKEDFNKHLHEGLTYHKTYWGCKKGLNPGGPPMCDDPQGFISWPLTALAAMAYDKGFKIEVESDYIPKWMVEGEFSE